MHLSTRLDILAFGQFDFMKMEKVVLIISTLIAFILSAHAENPEPRQIGCPEEDLKFGDIVSTIQGVSSWEDCGTSCTRGLHLRFRYIPSFQGECAACHTSATSGLGARMGLTSATSSIQT